MKQESLADNKAIVLVLVSKMLEMNLSVLLKIQHRLTNAKR